MGEGLQSHGLVNLSICSECQFWPLKRLSLKPKAPQNQNRPSGSFGFPRLGSLEPRLLAQVEVQVEGPSAFHASTESANLRLFGRAVLADPCAFLLRF